MYLSTQKIINKKTLIVGAMIVSLTMGSVVLSGHLRQKTTKEAGEQNGQSIDVASVVTQSHANTSQNELVESAINTTNVHFVSIEQANLDDNQKQHIINQIHNLEHTGSTSGGVLTHEFKSATHAKMSYRFGRKQPLAFDMVKMGDVLPSGFVLTGREYEGVLGKTGFDGVYRLFEHPSTKARLEITETYIYPNRPLTLIKELYREDIDGVPLRFEQLIDKKGDVYYHGEFAVGDRYVVINSRGMNLPEFMLVVDSIIMQAKVMKNPSL